MRLALTLLAVLTALPLAAKDKPTQPAPAQLTLEWSLETAAATGSTLDWSPDGDQPRGRVATEAFVPLGPLATQGLLLVGSAEARAGVRDPSGSRALLALTRTQGQLLAGWRWDTGPFRLDLVAGADAVTDLASSDALRPPAADPAQFWTRVLPRWGLAASAKGHWGDSSWKLEGLALGGKDAEVAWGRSWNDVADLATRGRWGWVVDQGVSVYRFGLDAAVSWSSGVVDSVWKDSEGLEVRWELAKTSVFTLHPAVWSGRSDSTGTKRSWSTTVSLEAGREQTLVWNVGFTWLPTVAVTGSLGWKENL